MNQITRAIRVTAVFLLASSTVVPAFCQNPVDPSQTYERLYAILPLSGQGTWDDPKRPMFTPTALQMRPGDRSGIIAFHHDISDDGRFALVEIVAATTGGIKAAAAQIKESSHVPDVQLFERGKHRREDLDKAFKAKKRDFDLDRFRAIVP